MIMGNSQCLEIGEKEGSAVIDSMNLTGGDLPGPEVEVYTNYFK